MFPEYVFTIHVATERCKCIGDRTLQLFIPLINVGTEPLVGGTERF